MMDTHTNKPRRRRLHGAALLLAVAVALLLATVAATQNAQAQEPPPPVDLSLSLRHGLTGGDGGGGRWIFALTNHEAGRHVHRGQVKITFTPYIRGTVEISGGTGQHKDPDFDDFDPATGIWHFRNLAPGQTKELRLFTDLRPEGAGAGRLVIGQGELISSVPKEDPMFRHNNATRKSWKFDISGFDGKAEGNVILEMQVSDRSPEVNDTVDFTVTFRNQEGLHNSLYALHDMYDVRVKLNASPGLELVSASPPSGTFGSARNNIQVTSSFDRDTGIWDLGNVDQNIVATYIDMPVTARYTGAVPLEEACLTAELVNVVPPEDPDPRYQQDSKVRVCLGEDPTVLIREAGSSRLEVPLLNVYPCVGATAYPCNDRDTVELVAEIDRDIMRENNVDVGRADVKRDDTGWAAVLQPDNIVIQVVDTHLVRGKANAPTWRTGSKSTGSGAAGIIPGVVASIVLPSPAYSSYTFAISGVGTLPGSMKMVRASNIGFTILDPVNKQSLGPLNVTIESLSIVFEFGSLGTYVADITLGATHKATSTTDTDTGRYTFHVGPVSELEVQAAWVAPGVLTVTALNHGPDEAPAARVTVTPPPGLRLVRGESSQGTFANGVWDIGMLEVPKYRRALGLPEGATLTIHTAGVPGQNVTGKIENAQDYCVRIKTGATDPENDRECVGGLPSGYTEHSAAYYDHRPDNNRFAITPKEYFHAAGILAPALTATPSGQDAVVLSWTAASVPPGTLTGYQVQLSSDAGATWTDLATITDPSVTTYTHQSLSPSATRHYRVRATDSGGMDNPWSNTATATTFVLAAPTVLRAESTQPTAIVLSWTAATGATGYQVQASSDAGATWTVLATISDGAATTYTHRGLTTGVTRHYRVRATGMGNSLSAWSNTAGANTRVVDEVPGVRAVQKPGYHPVVLEWRTLEDPAGCKITGFQYWRSDTERWRTFRDGQRYGGTGSSDPDDVYIQPDHLTAYGLGGKLDEFLYYVDWAAAEPEDRIRFRVRILWEGGQCTPTPTLAQTPGQTPGQNSPGGRGEVGVAVPADSPLIPPGVAPGDSFRLLFVTSTTTTAEAADIAAYNGFARARAGANADLAGLSGHFTALVSTATVDARDNTGTTGTGVPVHWLGGDKVADGYADLYDGDWDSVTGRTGSGGSYTGLVWTGGNKAGGRSGQRYAGAAEVRLGDLGDATLPLSSLNAAAATQSYPLYALSPVMTVALGVQESAANNEPQFGAERVARSVGENSAAGTTVGSPVTATDGDGDTLTYALFGSDAFAIDESSGQITVQGALDHETQASYSLTVTVSDGRNASGEADAGVDDFIAVTVRVGNVDEDGFAFLWPQVPRVGHTVTASFIDLDGGERDQAWTWARSADGKTNWADIDGAIGASYSPSDNDVGSYLRATVSYTDRQGPGKSAAVVTKGAVEPATTVTVPADSPLVPAGMGSGDRFRLLFITSASTSAESSDITGYNAFAQSRAGANTNLAGFSGQFRALISTATVNAKDNTGTNGDGVPVYWLGSARVANDYADLYDGDWDSVGGKTETGSSYTGLVWTGGNKQGGRSGQRYAGAAEVRLGNLGDDTLPLSSPNAAAATQSYPLYALSPVITVAQPE